MMEINNNKNYCVILAGGRGQRLWPVSREQYPKQFLDLFGTGRTLLQTTYDRFARLLPKDNILICTCAGYLELVKEQLPEVDTKNIIVEPIHRNTAPSVAWAAMRIHHHTPDANIIVSPSDQLILNESSFEHSMEVGISYVTRNNVLLAMGVKPTRAEPGYGYIQLGDLSCKPDVFEVKSFTEKPEREFARMFMESGEFYWNTGIYLANVRHMREVFLSLFPELNHRLDHIRDDETLESELAFVDKYYPSYPNMSLDYGVLERSENVYVMKCDFGWADLGTWHGIYECMQKGQEDNVIIDSEALLDNCSNNVIKLPKGKVGVFNGLDGFIVADEGNVLMICKKGDSSALVRKYANEVGIKYGENYI